jgi:drug/metabolite transporter (DMT)-like permease
MLGGSLAFTLMAELAHVLTHQCDWQIVVIARSGLVALFAACLAFWVGARLVFVGPLRLWVRSIAGSCSMLCTFFAFSRLPAADVLTLTNTFPIWVALFSWPLYGTPPGAKTMVAILIGMIGVGLVEQPHLETGNSGVFAALAAAVLTAVAMLGLHSLRGIDPRAIVVHFSAVATVFCVAAYGVAAMLGTLAHHPAEAFESGVLFKLTAMAATATIGQLLLTLAFRGGSPAKVAVVGLTQIVMARAFDVALGEQEMDVITFVGTLLVIAPTAWLLSRPGPPDDHTTAPLEQPLSATLESEPCPHPPATNPSRATSSLHL